ncbi:MAG: hypothetical protein ACP5P1_10600 [Acidimicrobiales bacterium]
MTTTPDISSAHVGFTRIPFTKVVPADKLFERPARQEAVARIQHRIAKSALGVVIGNVVAGKTVALEAAVDSPVRTRCTVVYLANHSGGCRGLKVAITAALGATPRSRRAEAINQDVALPAAQEAEPHRNVVFICD